MKMPKPARELEAMIRDELSQHHELPPDFAITVVPDGDSWRASSKPDPAVPEQGELIARAVEIGDDLARHYDLAG